MKDLKDYKIELDSDKSIFNKNNTSWETGKYPLFLGDSMALLDSIATNYPKLFDLYKLQKSMDWSEDEVNLQQSRQDLLSTTQNNYDIMVKTLAFQWELDSTASRAIAPLFSPFISNSELWMAYSKISEMECVAEGTEVLTDNGWKDISEIKVGDKVYQFNPDNDLLEMVEVSDTIMKPFKGNMVRFSDKYNYYKQLVTPNHRMIKFNKKTGEYVTELAKDMVMKKGSATGNMKGINVAKTNTNNSKKLSYFEKLLISLQADGSVDSRLNGNVYGTSSVTISCKKERKISLLEDMLENLQNDDRIKEFKELGCDQDGTYKKFNVKMDFYYNDKIKDFSWLDTNDVSPEWCVEFLNELTNWDCHDTRPSGKNSIIYSNANKCAVDKVQEICTLAGYRTNRRLNIDNRSENYSDIHVLSWIPDVRYTDGQSIKKEEVPYDGTVYCITVPSGYFVMRYEGAVSVTGNCLHSLTYSEIIRQCVADPQEVYKEVMHSDEVLNRSVAVIEAFNVLDTYGAKYKLGLVDKDDRGMHYAILKALIALLCLEGIEFMASFACTFALAEQNIFMGIAKLVQKIMLDENVHVMVGKEVLGILLHNEQNIWTELFEENKEDLTKMVFEVIEQELSWNSYIFSEGRSIVGLNKVLLDEWVLWKSQEIMEFLRMENPYEKIKTNPLRWMDNWEDLNKKQNANQEGDNTNYRLNAVKDDSEDVVFEL